MKRKFVVLVVLGSGWKRYPRPGETPDNTKLELGKTPDNTKLELSDDSKISATAAAYLLRENKCDLIIFSTGNTAGNLWPSEARAMDTYMANELIMSTERVKLEEFSIDTAGNAEEIYKVFKHNRWLDERILLMTVGYHLPRAKKLFANFHVPIYEAFDSYGVMRNAFNKHGILGPGFAVAKQLALSKAMPGENRGEKIKEFLLRCLLLIDPYGKLLRHITKIIRHQK